MEVRCYRGALTLASTLVAVDILAAAIVVVDDVYVAAAIAAADVGLWLLLPLKLPSGNVIAADPPLPLPIPASFWQLLVSPPIPLFLPFSGSFRQLMASPPIPLFLPFSGSFRQLMASPPIERKRKREGHTYTHRGRER